MLHVATRALRSIALAVAAAAALSSPATAAVLQVTDADIGPDQNVVWTADNTYVLNGFVFVEAGSSLTIAPGTVVKGKPGQGESASALIIARGGRIFASGTRQAPIVFTAEADDVADPLDLPLDARGLWGGVIILGNAAINSGDALPDEPGNQSTIEGLPTTETRGLFGGSDDNDNSGVFRYVSIRHGGTDIGAANEINGLSLGGVGRGTLVEYVEIYNNVDDGIEWFGGTVDTRYLVSAFNGDDGFDIDQGWRGNNQFWFLLQAADTGNNGSEDDGGTTPEDGLPYATPQIYNATLIGSGAGGDNGDNAFALELRDNFAGSWQNSIFTDFNGGGVHIEDLTSGQDSRNRLEEGTLKVANNIFYGFAAGDDLAGISACSGATCTDDQWVRDYMGANNNRIADPRLRGISRSPNNGLDPRPMLNSPALSGAVTPTDPWFQPVPYVGAFGPNDADLWIADWTFISQLGVVVQGDVATVVAAQSRLSAAVPAAYDLASAPNPWNPSTTITFALPVGGQVDLSLYNTVGQRVASLVQGDRAAGTYAVQLHGDELASGLYLPPREPERHPDARHDAAEVTRPHGTRYLPGPSGHSARAAFLACGAAPWQRALGGVHLPSLVRPLTC